MIGQALRVDRGERHGVRVLGLGPLRLRHPGSEQREGIGRWGEVGALVAELGHSSLLAFASCRCRHPAAERTFTISSL